MRICPALVSSSSNPKAGGPQLNDGDQEDGEDTDEPDAAMMAAMGFGGFGSTKQKEVDGNQEGAAFIKQQRTWRQYMNRKGGFNRSDFCSPLIEGY